MFCWQLLLKHNLKLTIYESFLQNNNNGPAAHCGLAVEDTRFLDDLMQCLRAWDSCRQRTEARS